MEAGTAGLCRLLYRGAENLYKKSVDYSGVLWYNDYIRQVCTVMQMPGRSARTAEIIAKKEYTL